MHQIRQRLALLFAPALFGCSVNGVVEPLPHFDAAQQIAPRSEPKVFQLRNVDLESLPPMVPFARIELSSGLDRPTSELVFEMASTLKADVVDVMDFERHLWGVDVGSNFLPNSIVPSRVGGAPVGTEPTGSAAVCYRVSPGDLGIRTDANQMVLVLENESARRAGLLEGDTLLSLDGIPYEPAEHSDALYSWRLAARPGDKVTLAWDRFGRGRMQGQAILLPTASDYLELPGVADHFLELQQQASLSRTRGF